MDNMTSPETFSEKPAGSADAPHLSPRLAMTASMVRPGMPLADVGTDHAYLPVWLLLQNKIPAAFCTDLRSGPLERASQTVAHWDVGDKVTLIQCNGFEDLDGRGCHDFVTAGMGGNLISDLLAAAPFLKDPATHLCLQPMSHAEDLRQYLFDNGYAIVREDLAEEPGHLYLAMEVVYTGEKKSYTMADCYLGVLPQEDLPLKVPYLEQILHRLETRYNALDGRSGFEFECTALGQVIQTVKECMTK